MYPLSTDTTSHRCNTKNVLVVTLLVLSMQMTLGAQPYVNVLRSSNAARGLEMSCAPSEQILPLRTIMAVQYIDDLGLGTSILGLGDINGDSKPDFAVAAVRIDRTFIYFGGEGTLDDQIDFVLRGGKHLKSGDLNGDGWRDLVIAGGLIDTLFVYFGKEPDSIGFDAEPDLVLSSDTSQFGTGYGSVYDIGDINGDGFDDLIVGARYFGHLQGKIYVYLGKPSFNAIPDFWTVGDSSSEFYGSRICLGDFNADGFGDVAIGIDRRKRVQESWQPENLLDIHYGPVWVFDGHHPDLRIDPQSSGVNPLFRISVFDVNTDGYTDIAIPYGDTVNVFLGSVEGIPSRPSFFLRNPDSTFYGAFGEIGVDVGDVNNDGWSDFAMQLVTGGDGCLAVYMGSPVPPQKPAAGRCVLYSNGYLSIAPVEDMDGDGVRDFALGASAALGGYFAILAGDSNFVTAVPAERDLPEDTEIIRSFPNPFNSSTFIRFTLSRPDAIVVDIFDMSGRFIRTIARGVARAGENIFEWDGRDEADQAAPSGVYLCRLKISQSIQRTTKLVLIR